MSGHNSREHKLDGPIRLLDGERVRAVSSIRVRHSNHAWGWYSIVSYRFVDRVGSGTMPAGKFNSLPPA